MKFYNHKFQNVFFCKLDEKNSIRLLSLNTNENKYSFNINCLIKFNKLKSNVIFKIPKKNIIKKINFINQYIFN